MPVNSIIIQKNYKWLAVVASGCFAMPAIAFASPVPRLEAVGASSRLANTSTIANAGPCNFLSAPCSPIAQQLPPPPPPRGVTPYQAAPPPPPLPASNAAPQSELPLAPYAVYVNGDSLLLLQIVQRVEPTATVLQYKKRRVILVGYFAQEQDAQYYISLLRNMGVEGKVTNFSDGELFSNSVPLR